MWNTRYRRGHRGFTLTELLVVMVIIVLLAGMAVTMVPKRIEEARESRTKAEIRILEQAVSQFQVHCQDPPDDLQGLVTKPSNSEMASRWKGPYLQHAVPKDGWNRDYIYHKPGTHNTDFDIVSCGKDGKEGTDDDVNSWEATIE
jgi:general secretion pathway protein G